jgi:hypothetical protein
MTQLMERAFGITCSNRKHDNCAPVRTAALALDEITEAYTTPFKSKIGGGFCVVATAVGTPAELNEVKKKIESIKLKKYNIKIEKVTPL